MVVLLFILSMVCVVQHKHQNFKKSSSFDWYDIPWTVKINVSLLNWIIIAIHPPIFDEGKNSTYDNSASHE